jgi:hypothetical protein
MRSVIVTGMLNLIGAMWFAALTSVKAATPGQGGVSAAAGQVCKFFRLAYIRAHRTLRPPWPEPLQQELLPGLGE